MKGPKFVATANRIANREAGARHQRRKAEKLAKQQQLSIPAMKKVIRRNKQRNGK